MWGGYVPRSGSHLELEYQALLRVPMWVLGVELGFSGRVVHVPNLWAVSPAPDFPFQGRITLRSVAAEPSVYAFIH